MVKVKLRHAAALALTGWYLMVPPMPYDHQTHEMDVDLSTPVSEWTLLGSFDTANDCKKRVDELIQQGGEAVDRHAKGAEQRLNDLTSAACIATDDPRLKGK